MSTIGEVIDTVARARGYTQVDLAMMIGATQATISRYISGARTPEEDEISRIAEALEVSPEFLQNDFRMRAAIGVSSHMRRQKSTKVSAWKSAEARLNEIRMHLSMLLEKTPLRTEAHVPSYDHAFTDPADAARRTRTAWRVPMGPVRSLTNLLESAGVITFDLDLGTHRIDGLSQWVADYPVVVVNTHLTPSRRRMTLAHELGHLVLHADGYVDDEEIDVEGQANSFAAEFLMPEAEIRHELRNLKIAKLIALKREWGVSMQALFERAHRLGMTSQSDRQNFYKQLSRKGWRIEEPDEDVIPVEAPRLATGLIEQFRSAGLSDQEFAKSAGFASEAIPAEFLPSPRRHLRAV